MASKQVFAEIPNNYHRVQKPLDFGHPIVADAPGAPARVAIEKSARRIAGPLEEPAEAPVGSLFARFWPRARKNKPEPVSPG